MRGWSRAISATTFPASRLIVPRNMPGAGCRAAANWIYNIAPKDGTVLATADQSLSLQQAAGDKRINFDTTKFIYIGNPNVENNTTAAWHTSGIKTIDDAKKREVTVGATGGSTSSQYPKAMNALLGTKFKIVLGYPGGNDINLAMERGEVDGRGSNSWTSWKSTRPDWIAEKKINILVQIGLAKAPDLPDVPLLMDLGDQRRGPRAAARCCRPRPTSGGRSSPRRACRPSASRRCARPSTRWFTIRLSSRRRRREKFDIEPTTGEAMQKLVTEIMTIPKAQSERLKQIIE